MFSSCRGCLGCGNNEMNASVNASKKCKKCVSGRVWLVHSIRKPMYMRNKIHPGWMFHPFIGFITETMANLIYIRSNKKVFNIKRKMDLYKTMHINWKYRGLNYGRFGLKWNTRQYQWSKITVHPSKEHNESVANAKVNVVKYSAQHLTLKMNNDGPRMMAAECYSFMNDRIKERIKRRLSHEVKTLKIRSAAAARGAAAAEYKSQNDSKATLPKCRGDGSRFTPAGNNDDLWSLFLTSSHWNKKRTLVMSHSSLWLDRWPLLFCWRQVILCQLCRTYNSCILLRWALIYSKACTLSCNICDFCSFITQFEAAPNFPITNFLFFFHLHMSAKCQIPWYNH